MSNRDEPLDDAALRLCEVLGYSFADTGLLLDAPHPPLVQKRATRRSLLRQRAPGVPRRRRSRACGRITAVRTVPRRRRGRAHAARADLVSEKGLFEAAEAIGVGDAMRLGKGEQKSGGRLKPRLLASALEACIGAIYQDGGADGAFAAAPPVFAPRLHTSAPGHRDAKSRAQEWAQAHLGGTPSYRLIGSEGPDHDREFTVALELHDEEVATGTGRSKIEAEQSAAREALDKWAPEPDPST